MALFYIVASVSAYIFFEFGLQIMFLLKAPAILGLILRNIIVIS